MIIFLALSFCMLGGGYLYAMYWLSPPDFGLIGKGSADNNSQPFNGRLNLLLLGMDARTGETNSRTDSIIFASIDTQAKQAGMLSIPRDTRVQIPGYGQDKINAASTYGGPELAVKLVENLLGIPVDYYVSTNFSGFKDIVDTLGGVTIDVEKNMHYYDPTDNFLIDLKKGEQRMDGDKAIQYVRFRMDALGDISRTQRQQKFLVALAKEMLQPSTIVKLPKLIPQLNKNVQTNLGLMDMFSLARAGKDLDNMNIVTQTLPGNFLDINGVSYWGVEPEKAKLVVASLLRGEKSGSVVDENQPTTDVAEKVPAVKLKKAVIEEEQSTKLVKQEKIIREVDVSVNATPDTAKTSIKKPANKEAEFVKNDINSSKNGELVNKIKINDVNSNDVNSSEINGSEKKSSPPLVVDEPVPSKVKLPVKSEKVPNKVTTEATGRLVEQNEIGGAKSIGGG